MVSFVENPLVAAPRLTQVELETVTENIYGVLLPGISLEEAVETPSSLFAVLSLQFLLLLYRPLLFFGFFALIVMLDEALNGFWSFLLPGNIYWSTLLAEGLSILDPFFDLVICLVFGERSQIFFWFQNELISCRRVFDNDLSAYFNFGCLLHDVRIVLLLLLYMD